MIRIDLRKLAVSQACLCDTISSKAQPASAEHMENSETNEAALGDPKEPSGSFLHSAVIFQIYLRKRAVSQTCLSDTISFKAQPASSEHTEDSETNETALGDPKEPCRR